MDLLPSSPAWDSCRIPLALGVLAANSFFQPQSSLCQIWNIEPKTFRLLRLLPFVAAVDCFGCLLVVAGCCCSLRRSDFISAFNRLLQRLGSFTKNKSEKSQTEKLTGERGDTRTSASPSRRVLLAVFAIVQLFYLTWYESSTFACFCAWALFVSFALNLAVSRFAETSNRAQENVLPVPTVADIPSKRETEQSGMETVLIVALILGLALQFCHVAWLCQYNVPRRLWMGWGPKQIAQTDFSNLTFVIPPGMPPPTSLQLQTGEEIVIGFWPGRSISGAIFYTIDTITMAVLLSFAGTIFLAMPFFFITYSIWMAIVFAIGYGLYYLYLHSRPPVLHLYHQINATTFGRLAFNLIRTCATRLANPSKLVTVLILWPATLIGIVLLAIVWTGLGMAPVMMMSYGYIPLDPFDIFSSSFAMTFYFATIDYPYGAYAALTGTLFVISILVIRRWLPIFVGKASAQGSTDEKRYWTVAWTALVVCITSILFYSRFSHAASILA